MAWCLVKYRIRLHDLIRVLIETQWTNFMRFEVFTAMKILVLVFRAVTSCSDVEAYQLFGGL